MSALLRQGGVGIRLLLLFTLLLGVAYPAVVLAAGRVAADRADGSPLYNQKGELVGSALLGQSVSGPQWFYPRPSAADYDGLASGGSNLGPENADLVAEIASRQAEIADREHIAVAQVPADAVTASGSGLDPHISPEYAALQVPRVALAWRLPQATVRELVATATEQPAAGIFGQAGVNVVRLNLALQAAQ